MKCLEAERESGYLQPWLWKEGALKKQRFGTRSNLRRVENRCK